MYDLLIPFWALLGEDPANVGEQDKLHRPSATTDIRYQTSNIYIRCLIYISYIVASLAVGCFSRDIGAFGDPLSRPLGRRSQRP